MTSKTRITTIVGTRPEIIRLSEVIKKLDIFFEHRLIHTGQNPDPNLKDIFFSDLGVRQPDLYFGGDHNSLGGFLSTLFIEMEKEFINFRPDAVVILGDTNSALAAILAKRLGIPVYHLEAGNRSFDLNVPEEINRRIVDHTSDFNMVYTEHARHNLLSEGIHPRKISLIGSPLCEVLAVHKGAIESSRILESLKLRSREFFLVSVHRQENVDFPDRLESLLSGLEAVATEYGLPILVSTHPRTRKKLKELRENFHELINFHEPFGFIDYNKLQISARMVLSDSGTISEEAGMLGFPAITLRDSMERPEALEAGTIVMSGIESEAILDSIRQVEAQGLGLIKPEAYRVPDTSTRVVNYILSTVHQYQFWNGLHKR
jgi:UDP-N-acetylglucosamine 2-epimerase (non-hydrolysing)